MYYVLFKERLNILFIWRMKKTKNRQKILLSVTNSLLILSHDIIMINRFVLLLYENSRINIIMAKITPNTQPIP
jgi:hypothetical protein